MPHPKSIQERLEKAIEAGYWIARDHGWVVGRGMGADSQRLYGGERFPSKAEARKAMIRAWLELSTEHLLEKMR